MNIRQEITAFSPIEDRDCLLWLISKYNWASQWRFVASATWHPNKEVRIWASTIEGQILYENRERLSQGANNE